MPSINDNFADAIEVTIATNGGTYTSSSLDTAGNTTESGEPAVSASANVSAWWKYTPNSSGTATFDTMLSTATTTGTDTYMAIWTGTNFGDMVNVATDDDSGGAAGGATASSRIADLSVTAGTTYWIQVGGFGNQTMNLVLRVVGPASGSSPDGNVAAVTATATAAAHEPTLTGLADATVQSVPATGTMTAPVPVVSNGAASNDDFADAMEVVISTEGGTYTSPSVDTENYTTETDEPSVSASANVSAWWKYTPVRSGSVTLDTQLSTPTSATTDTYMAVWTGTNFTNLVAVATDDDNGGAGTSRIVDLPVTAGTTYWIQVGGFGTMTMNVVLRAVGEPTVVLPDATVNAVAATATATALAPGFSTPGSVAAVPATATAALVAPVASTSAGASLRQSATDSSTSGSTAASFPSPPVEGNLLHAVVCDRSGASTSALSGSGWTLREEEVVAQANGTYRFYMAVWEKIAGASEPTTVTATLTGTCAIVLCEWEAAGEAFNFDTSTSASSSNAGTITSQTTGSTGPTTGTQACFAFCGIKSPATNPAPWTTWTNSFTNEVAFDGGADVIDISVSLLNTGDTGAKTTTASGAGTDRSTAGAIIVHHLGEPSPDAIITAPLFTVTMLAPVPAVDNGVGSPGTVSSVTAAATAEFVEPVVSGETLLEGGGAATATAEAIPPAVSGNGGTPANVGAVKATATSTANAPVVEGATVLQGGGAASATARMVAPVVLGNGGIAVIGVRAIATAAARAPVVTGETPDATVAGVVALVTARVISPTISTVEPTYFFSPPTHEEPIRTREKPLVYYRLTYAMSVVRINGNFVQVRTPMPEVLEGLEAGVDYFRGGYEYEVSRETALELEAAGYTVTQL